MGNVFDTFVMVWYINWFKCIFANSIGYTFRTSGIVRVLVKMLVSVSYWYTNEWHGLVVWISAMTCDNTPIHDACQCSWSLDYDKECKCDIGLCMVGNFLGSHSLNDSF